MWITAIVFALTLLAGEAIGQAQGYFWWNVKVDGADRVVTALAPTFALFGSPDTLELKWVFKNDEGTGELSFVPASIQSGLRMVVTRDGRQVEAAVAWASTGNKASPESTTPVAASASVALAAGEWIEWKASIRRADARAWTAGEYQLAFDLTAALPALTSEGKPWRGRAEPQGTVTVRLAQATSLADRKARHRTNGGRALANGSPDVAVAEYRALVQADPNDRAAHGALGKALVAAGQFRQAIQELETALPVSLSEKSTVPEVLAYAYVVVGDDANATRVLRMVVAERDVTVRMDQLRSAAARRQR